MSMELVRPGTPVVRGPNWKYGNQDGGDGNVGTITSITDGKLVVQWDTSGDRRKYTFEGELRVFDTATVEWLLPIMPQRLSLQSTSNAGAVEAMVHPVSSEVQPDPRRDVAPRVGPPVQGGTVSLFFDIFIPLLSSGLH
eukprot:gene14661-16187_t